MIICIDFVYKLYKELFNKGWNDIFCIPVRACTGDIYLFKNSLVLLRYVTSVQVYGLNGEFRY